MTVAVVPRQAAVSTGRRLPLAASVLLDLIRLGAALLVVVAHAGKPEFSTGFPACDLLGDIAVPVFFVLSGFVIRLITTTRSQTLGEFVIDRASRIYSVVLPAAGLTLLLNAFCALGAPVYYQEFFADFATHPLSRILLNLSFLSQSWSHSTVFFINSPFWSLGYECLYYAGYGLLFYLRGLRRTIALMIWVALAGPQVLFLLPAWALGCWVHDEYQSPTRSGVLTAAALALAGAAIIRQPNPLLWLHIEPHRATMLALGTAMIASAAMLVLLRFSALIAVQPTNAWVVLVQRMAEGTFAIYLFHYPLMVFADAAGLFQPGRPAITLASIAAICAFSIFSARPLDRFKLSLRRALRRLA